MSDTYAFLRWLDGVPTVELLERLRNTALSLNLRNRFEKEAKSRGLYIGGGGGHGVGHLFSDPNAGLPKSAPGFEVVAAYLNFADGSEAFRLILSDGHRGNALHMQGKVYVAQLSFSERFSPYYSGGDNLELAVRQYELLKTLHRKLSPDRSWSIDRKQMDFNDGSDLEQIEEALCWFALSGRNKLIRHLEEQRAPSEEDTRRLKSGGHNWEIFQDGPLQDP